MPEKEHHHHPEQPAAVFYEHAAMTAIKMAEQLQQEGLLPRFEDMQTDEEQQRAYVDQLDRLYERLCLNQGLPWPPPRNGQPERKLLFPRFALGEIVATQGAQQVLKQAEKAPAEYLLRHVQGDWGELHEEDIKENEFSVEHGFRLLSNYPIPETGERLWIITEYDRSVTTILRPDEY
jgi:hypothetical protein